MALIEKLLNWQPGTLSPKAESNPWISPAFWGLDSASGPAVGPDTALKISTVYACMGLLSETIASLPLVVFRYIENEEGRERARNHPLYPILHDQPNETQTAFDFTQMMQAHALMRGSGYAKMVAGPRGFVDQLIPLHPNNVRKEKLTNGRIRYQVTEDDGRVKAYNNEDIFEVGGLTLDGWNTVSVITYARDSLGLNLAAERYGSRFFRNDSRPGGVLKTDTTLKGDAAKRIKAEWETLHAGGNQHRVAVLEQGLEWQQIGISPEEAQFLGTREFQAEDVTRWFRVPPHMVGLTSKATSWGSGIEEMNIGFLTYTLRPWLTRWTQAIKRDLILAPQTYFADFIVEGLLRGDIETRYNAYAVGRQWGWLSVNEIRQRENLNPVAGGDQFLTPLNMSPAGAGGQGSRGAGGNSFSSAPPLPHSPAVHYRLLAEESAARLVRKEIAAIGRMANGEWGEDQADQVSRFYRDHVALVAQAMRIPMEKAAVYCDRGRNEVLEKGAAALADWEPRRVLELADLAMSTEVVSSQ
jgi:HK97 family phage portal protein